MTRSRLLSILLALLILGACGVAAWRLWPRAMPVAAEGGEGKGEEEETKPIEVALAVVRSGTLPDDIRVTGTLQPLPNGQSKVAAQVSGRVEDVLIRPGQAVAGGALLVTLSRPDLEAVARQSEAAARETRREIDALKVERETKAHGLPLLERKAQAEANAARSRLELLRAGSRPEEIDRAEAAVQAAQAELERLKKGARPQELAQAEAAVRDARAGRDALQKDVARKRGLLEKGIVAAKDVERAEADLTTAQVGSPGTELEFAL